jgi:hypothetical protein
LKLEWFLQVVLFRNPPFNLPTSAPFTSASSAFLTACIGCVLAEGLGLRGALEVTEIAD